jgi:hypothetical protein
LDSRRHQPFIELGPDASGLETTSDLALVANTGLFEEEDILRGDLIALHADTLG